jgi:hypothetical protein
MRFPAKAALGLLSIFKAYVKNVHLARQPDSGLTPLGDRRGLNPRPQDPQTCALPTELRSPFFGHGMQRSTNVSRMLNNHHHPVKSEPLF